MANRVRCLLVSWMKARCKGRISFFLYLKRPLFTQQVFRGFWRDMRLTNDKDYVIRNCEVGFSRMLSEHGIGWFAAFSYDAVQRRAKAKGPDFQYRDLMASAALNPTLFMWDILLSDFGYPFIKTELLRTNRFDSRAVPSWRALLPPSNDRLAADIQQYLDRVITSR